MDSFTVGFLNDMHNGGKTALSANPKTGLQKQLLERYEDTVRWFGHLDLLVLLGDLTHGIMNWDNDFEDEKCTLPPQINDVCELIDKVRAKEIIVVSGTAVHEGGGLVQTAQIVASMLKRSGKNSSFSRKLMLCVNDWFRISARHKVGSSKVPYGRATLPSRAKIWSVVNAALESSRSGKPAKWANLMAFAHVHYFCEVRDAFGRVVTLPCWQAEGSVFGDEQCEGHTDVGAYKVTIPKDQTGEVLCQERLYPLDHPQRWVNR